LTMLRHHRVPDATAVAAGWDGDRIWVYQNKFDESAVWGTIWDSDADADAFASTIGAVLTEGTIERFGQEVWVFFDTPASTAGVVRSADLRRVELRSLADLPRR